MPLKKKEAQEIHSGTSLALDAHLTGALAAYYAYRRSDTILTLQTRVIEREALRRQAQQTGVEDPTGTVVIPDPHI